MQVSEVELEKNIKMLSTNNPHLMVNENSRLFTQSCYIVSNSNHIFIDYPKFKHSIHSSLHNDYMAHVFYLIYECLTYYSSYEIHVNMQSFSITAAQRYKDVIYVFIQKLTNTPDLMNKLTKLCLYQTSKMMDGIIQLFSGFVSDDQMKGKLLIIQ